MIELTERPTQVHDPSHKPLNPSRETTDISLIHGAYMTLIYHDCFLLSWTIEIELLLE
jgi:hypothetical protein